MKRKIYLCGCCGKKFEIPLVAKDYVYKYRNEKMCSYTCYLEYKKQKENIKRLGLKEEK